MQLTGHHRPDRTPPEQGRKFTGLWLYEHFAIAGQWLQYFIGMFFALTFKERTIHE
jgi:hypothetical protein